MRNRVNLSHLFSSTHRTGQPKTHQNVPVARHSLCIMGWLGLSWNKRFSNFVEPGEFISTDNNLKHRELSIQNKNMRRNIPLEHVESLSEISSGTLSSCLKSFRKNAHHTHNS